MWSERRAERGSRVQRPEGGPGAGLPPAAMLLRRQQRRSWIRASWAGPSTDSPATATLGIAQAVAAGDAEALSAALAARRRTPACRSASVDPLNAKAPRTGYTPLHLAARLGDAEAVTALLSAGAFPNIGDVGGLSPLHHATRGRHLLAVSALLAGNANPNQLTAEHYTPVHFACRLGTVPITRALVRARGRVDVKTKDTASSPLHLAVLGRRQDVLECLLAEGVPGADLNVTDGYGYTPLHRAAQMGLPDAVRALVGAGASRSFRGRWDWTALHWAASCGQAACVAALLELGAVQGVEDNDGNIAYDVALDDACRALLNPVAPRISAAQSAAMRHISRRPTQSEQPSSPLHANNDREAAPSQRSGSESSTDSGPLPPGVIAIANG